MSDLQPASIAQSHQAGTRKDGQRPLQRAFSALLNMSERRMEHLLRLSAGLGAVAGGVAGFKLYASTSVGAKTLCFVTGLSAVCGAGLGMGLTGLAVGGIMLHQARKARASHQNVVRRAI